MTKTVLSQNEVDDFAGFKSMLDSFYDEVKKELSRIFYKIDDEMSVEFIQRISDYIMRKLHSTLWAKEELESQLSN